MTLKLLCAGANDTSFQPIKSAFEEEDINIIRATSIALTLFLARKNLPHLIICEQDLTDGDLSTLFSEIKNDPDLAQIPVLKIIS